MSLQAFLQHVLKFSTEETTAHRPFAYGVLEIKLNFTHFLAEENCLDFVSLIVS